MRRNQRMLSVAAVLVLAVLRAVSAQPCTFNKDVDDWNDLNNWTCGRVPLATDEVIVPFGKTVIIDQFSADAKFINVATDPSGGQGEIVIRRGGKLTLHGDSNATTESTINGIVRLEDNLCSNCDYPELIIRNTHKFRRTSSSGAGGRVVGADNLRAANQYGIIRGYDSNSLLILGDVGDAATAGLTGNLDVRVNLQNDGEVNATPDGGTTPRAKLIVTTSAKTGSGKWKATHGDLHTQVGITGNAIWEAGRDSHIYIEAPVTCNTSESDDGLISALADGDIIIDAEVEGSAPWLLDERLGYDDPLIQMSVTCDELSGGFTMHCGALDARGDLCTSGEFDADGGRIVIADSVTGYVLKFSQGCP